MVLACSCGGQAPTATTATVWAPPPVRTDALHPQLAKMVRNRSQRSERNPGDAQAVGALGVLCQANDLWEAAAQCFQRAAELDPGEPHWAYHGAIALRASGEHAAALELLLRVEADHPDFAPMQNLLGTALLENARFDEARPLFERLIRERPDLCEGPLGLAEIALAEGRPDAAVEHLEEARRLEPGYRRINYLLGIAYRDLGRTEEARRELTLGAGAQARRLPDRFTERLVKLSFSRTVRNKRAVQLLAAGRAEESRALLQATLQLDPADARTRVNLAIAERRLGNHGSALEHLKRAAELAPDSHQVHVNLGETLVEMERWDEALTAAEQAVVAGPNTAAAYRVRGQALLGLGRTEEGRRDLEHCLSLDPGDVQGLKDLGNLLVGTRDFAGAQPHFEALARLAPNHWQTHYDLGVVYAFQGLLDQAERSALEARSLAPDEERVDGLLTMVSELREAGR